MTLRGLFLCGAAPCLSCTLWSAHVCLSLWTGESSVDSSGEQQPDPACKPFSRASPPILWPSNAYDMLGLLADKKTVNVMLNPLSEGLNVITKMEAHFRKVAELEKLALDMYSVPTEIKEIISNAESFKTVTVFQSQIVTVEEKPFLEHVE